MPLEGYDVRKRILKYRDKEPVRQTICKKDIYGVPLLLFLLLEFWLLFLLRLIFLKQKFRQPILIRWPSVEFENNKEAVDKCKSSEASMLVIPLCKNLRFSCFGTG